MRVLALTYALVHIHEHKGLLYIYRRCKHQIFSQLPELTQIALNLFDCFCVSLSKEPGVAVTVANAQATTLT